jgi:hypothetical protein
MATTTKRNPGIRLLAAVCLLLLAGGTAAG